MPSNVSAATEGFVPFPDDAVAGSVADRFLQVAEAHAHRPALSSPSRTSTYREMAADVLGVAGAVQGLVGSPEPTPVAVLADHDGALVVAILAVIAAGHVVVVLDPTTPAEVLDHAMAESGAPVVLHDAITAEAAADLAGRTGATPASLDDLLAEPGPAPTLPSRTAADPAMLAFTSGTSGAPKAAIITHGVITNLVRGATNALGVTSDDRMPMLFPTSLAVASYPMFIPLLNGGTLATLDVRSVGLAPVPEFLRRERITLAYMAPTVVRFLVDAVAGFEFPDLRMVALGGEPVDAEVVQLTRDLFGPDLLANGFGTTETGVIALQVIDPAEPVDGAVPSGYAVPDVELGLVDDTGEPVEPGESGEVLVVSPYIFDGYRNHEELTSQVIGRDPQGRPGWFSYRTGDLGHFDADGALVVDGRLDTKVKVRGRFVVLGDVEAALRELDDVTDAGVVVLQRGGNTELGAVVVPAPGTDPDPAALRALLAERHEAYRVPSRWRIVAEMPRLPNGKTDRRALADLVEGATPASDTTAADRAVRARDAIDERRTESVDRIERSLRDIWEEVLPTNIVGRDDDFFDLGGDSLLAAQMLVFAEHRLGIAVPMGELVHARTLRSLAAVMSELASRSHKRSTVAVVQHGDPERPRLWFVHDLQGSAFRVRHLATALGPDQPVWSFESPLLAGEPNRFGTLDAFATRYVDDLLAAQPEGPYWLAGYSFGGICAYEMARQLQQRGHEVAFVGIVDVGPAYRGPNWREDRVPFRPWFGVDKPPPAGTSLAGKVRYYRDMLQRSPRVTARHLMVLSGAYRPVDRLRFRLDLRRHGRVRPEWRLWYAWEEHWNLSVHHWDRTRPYSGRVDLLWASQTPATDDTMGWGPYVADLHIHRFEGFHDDLLEDRGAPRLGVALREVLDARRGG